MSQERLNNLLLTSIELEELEAINRNKIINNIAEGGVNERVKFE